MLIGRPAHTWGALRVVTPPCSDFWSSCAAGTHYVAAGREKQPQNCKKTTQGHSKSRRNPKFLCRTAKKHAGQLKMPQGVPKTGQVNTSQGEGFVKIRSNRIR